MKCPKCEIFDLAMTDRAGIEIDYCTTCRGVWLDRGELDKIIERSPLAPSAIDRPFRPEKPAKYESDYKDYKKDRYDDDDYKHKKRKKNLFEELFDF